LDDYKSKLLRKLKAKCSELNNELSEVNSIYEKSVPLFCSEVCDYCAKNSIENPLEKLKKETKEKNNPEVEPEFKSLYRKIAIETHPDKVANNEKKLDTYKEATEAKKQNKIDKLVSIAKDLKINLNKMKFSDIKRIEESIIKTEKTISDIRNSYVWLWVFSSKKERKDIIVKFILNNV
jgi:hypothetical protein